MKEEKLVTLIKSLEVYARKHPGPYRLRVALLAALGYLYLLIVVSILLGIVVAVLLGGHFNFITIKILWIPLVLVGLVVQSLWVTIPEPDGKELTKEQAPALFEMVAEVRRRLDGPVVHHLFVSDEFNCGIVQIPRFGMFGWPSNYLVVGLPLLRALSPEELRSVLAHEFGHLSGKHGHFSGWIYRVRHSWVEILTTVHRERSYAAFLFEPFLKWYAPYLNAYSFVLARDQEREADRYSVELSGKDVAIRTLTRIMTKERTLSDIFWPDFFRQSRDLPQPPKNPFGQMLEGVERGIGPAKAQSWFHQAMTVPTGYDDTHPSLGDRLEAMGFQKDSDDSTALIEALVAEDEKNEPNAASFILEFPEDFLPRLDRLWRERIVQPWHDAHKQTQQSVQRLGELEEQARNRQLTIDELLEKVQLLMNAKSNDDALPTIEQVLKEDPDHDVANFALGAILIERGDATGVESLEKAIARNRDLTLSAYELIFNFYHEQGQRELAESYRIKAKLFYEKDQLLQAQATTFSPQDHFEPHGLDAAVIEDLKQRLATVRGLSTAFIVRKIVAESTEPIYVLGIVAAFTWQNGVNARHSRPVLDELVEKIHTPRPLVFIAIENQHQFLFRTFDQIPEAQIFTTEDTASFGITYRR